MDIKQLAKKYNLKNTDFWQFPQNKDMWIITHDACEKIARTEEIIFDKPVVYTNPELERIAMFGYGSIKDEDDKVTEVWSTGEANKDNCFIKYYWSMAEKRLRDRLTLKLIGAYDYQIYSETEADEFRLTESGHSVQSTPSEDFSRDFVFKFGKHEGKMIKEVPVGYLEYFLNDEKDGWMKDFAEQELKARTKETPKAYDDEITTPTHLAIDALLNVPGMPIKAIEKINQFLKEKPTEKAAQKRLKDLKTVLDQVENK